MAVRQERILFLCIILTVIGLSRGVCFGKIYKYQDASGKWIYTDSEEKIPKDATIMKGTIDNDSEMRDLKKQLHDRFSPKNQIEEATLAAITIKTPIGSGSGFFITDDGYILTNKHVIRMHEQVKESAKSQIENVDKRVEHISKQLDMEESRLKSMRESVERLKKRAEAERDPSMKSILEDRYRTDNETLESMEKDFKSRKKEFLDQKGSYERDKRDFRWKSDVADQSRTFKIILKDNSEYDAYVVTISQQMDLALLKLDKCKTPFLKPLRPDKVSQGQTVYAIGSPAGLRDSVSSGVISGFEGAFVRTDARIYPGNSGGPLVNESGEVLGINTFKEITHNFEGLGFAIKITTAIDQFANLSKVRYGE